MLFGRSRPWHKGDAYATPVSGMYRFKHADLAKFQGIAGILQSAGNFDGSVQAIRVAGDIAVPEFEIRSASHAVNLKTSFRARVNGHNGDVALDHVDSRFLRTAIMSAGAVASPAEDEPKSLSLDAAFREARRLAFRQSVARLQQASSAAVTTLLKIMVDPTAPHSTRVRAADSVLGHSAKAIEIEDIEARVSELERSANQKAGGQ
jgi:hypothetical protein